MSFARMALASVAVVLACGGFSSARGKAEVDLGVKLSLEQRRLSNGLQVILIEDHTIPIVSYQTWYRVGSVHEDPGMTGISHLFEHLMFKGTPRYPAKQFFVQLEAKGAEVNAFTTRDYTVYYENFIPDLLEKVIDMESDRMAHLELNEGVLESERQVVFEERRLRTDNSPEGRMQEALWQLAYRVHPYRWPVIGYPEDLASIRLEQLKDYYRLHYQPANAAIVIVGDMDPDLTFERLKRHYGGIPSVKMPARTVPQEPAQNEERIYTMRDAVASERFAQAFHIPSALDDDSYALDVLANILFEGTSSRAYRRLVEEDDVMSGVSGSAFTPGQPGLFLVSGTMKPEVSHEIGQRELARVIQELQDQGVSQEEVRVAVKQLTVQLVDSVRTPQGLAQLVGTVQSIFGDPSRFAKDLARYTRVTAADVQRVAQKYLVPNNRSVVLLLPQRAGPGVKPAKKGGSK